VRVEQFDYFSLQHTSTILPLLECVGDAFKFVNCSASLYC
jgi:hypothetical protein